MSDNQSSSSKLPLIIIALLAIVGGYFLLSPKEEMKEQQPVATETTEAPEATTPGVAPTEQTEATTEPAVTPPEQPPVVVETKTLNLPKADTPNIPTTETTSSPEVQKMMGLRTLGSDDAPIKVVEYASLTCGHCASFHNTDLATIKTKYIDTGKVQFIFKEFPLNKPAVDATKLLRCLPEDKFNPFQSMLFESQDKWAYAPEYLDILKQNAKLAGLSEQEVDACLNNKELEDRIVGDMKAASEMYKIQSTPTFVVNNGVKTIVGHQPMNVFEETFDGILNGTLKSEKAEKAE